MSTRASSTSYAVAKNVLSCNILHLLLVVTVKNVAVLLERYIYKEGCVRGALNQRRYVWQRHSELKSS